MTISSNTLDLTNARIKSSPYAGWFGTSRHYYGDQKLGFGDGPAARLGASPFGTAREAGANFLFPGGAHHYFALQNSEANMDTKILLSGITEQEQIGFGVGNCTYPTMEVAGLAILIGYRISLSTGSLKLPFAYFTEDLGLPINKVLRLNQQLIASGVFGITVDEEAKTITYELTTFGLSQCAAVQGLVRAYETVGQPIGAYLNVVIVLPNIAAQIDELMSFLDSLQAVPTA